jgi:hypothetical protein
MRFSILPDATMCEDTSVGACNVGLLSEGTKQVSGRKTEDK